MHVARPRSPRPRERARGVRRLLAELLVGMCLLVLGAAPAGAHAELESSSPKDGAILASPPATLSFTFGEDLLDTGEAITLAVTATEERLELDAPTVDGDTITVPWPEQAPAGEFMAAYRVVSEDGHPVVGAITFSVEHATGRSATAQPQSSPSTIAPVPSGLPSAVASAAPAASAAPGGAAAPESQPEAGVLAWVLGIGVVALVGALAASWVTRRTNNS